MIVSGAIVAVCEVIKASLEYATKHRETMSPENRDKWDALLIRGSERWQDFLDLFDKENRK